MDVSGIRLSFTERLHTFDGLWIDAPATARQLAAMGHVSDRPPLEAIEEGSRCIKCVLFVPKRLSITTLEGSIDPSRFIELEVPSFHHARCEYLQIRLPFTTPGWADLTMSTRQQDCYKPEKFSNRVSHFLRLPVEVRLEIYRYSLPVDEPITGIVQVACDSMRVTTATASNNNHFSTDHPDATRIGLLRTCKVIHDEVLDSMYNRTTYKFASTKVLYMFLRRIGHRGRQFVRSVDVLCGAREDAVAFALLACCPSVSSIVIRLPRPTLMFARAPQWTADGIASLMDMSGFKHVGFGMCQSPTYLSDDMPDAKILRTELMRPRNTVGRTRFVNGVPDL